MLEVQEGEVVSKVLDQGYGQQGADRERRRIRRAQRGWIHVVCGFIATVPVTSAANAIALDALSRIDAATRTKRGRR